MKKIFCILSLLIITLVPSFSFAETIFDSNMATISTVTDQIYFKAFVCKLEICDYKNEADWQNFTSSPVSEGETEGDGSTLVVKPGDTLTFLGEVRTNSGDGISPQFHVEFTGSEYMDLISYFETGQDDLDEDGIAYHGDSDNIHFSDPITAYVPDTEDPAVQYGSITAKVKDSAPDNTVITAKFILDQMQPSFTANPFVKVALADDIARSGVRILVSNPTAQTAQQVLPKTGVNTYANNYLFPIAILMVFASFIGYQVVIQKRKQVK